MNMDSSHEVSHNQNVNEIEKLTTATSMVQKNISNQNPQTNKSYTSSTLLHKASKQTSYPQKQIKKQNTLWNIHKIRPKKRSKIKLTKYTVS